MKLNIRAYIEEIDSWKLTKHDYKFIWQQYDKDGLELLTNTV
jgi:hypothetical protein